MPHGYTEIFLGLDSPHTSPRLKENDTDVQSHEEISYH